MNGIKKVSNEKALGIVAMQLSAPREGYLVWFQTSPYGAQHWFHRWYGSLSRARAAAKRMALANPVIIGFDHSVN